MQRGEILVMLTYLGVRAGLAAALGLVLWQIVIAFVAELAEDTSVADPAVTGFLGLAIGALATALTALVSSLTVDVLGYLKDRLNRPAAGGSSD